MVLLEVARLATDSCVLYDMAIAPQPLKSSVLEKKHMSEVTDSVIPPVHVLVQSLHSDLNSRGHKHPTLRIASAWTRAKD